MVVELEALLVAQTCAAQKSEMATWLMQSQLPLETMTRG